MLPKLGSSPSHLRLHVLQRQVLLLEILDIDFPLISEDFPVNTDTQVCGISRVRASLELGLVPSLFADVILIPLLHLIPHIQLKHGLVVPEPAVLDAGDVEAGHGKEAGDDGTEADEDPEFLGLLNWVQAVVVQESHVGVRGHHSEDCDEKEEH